MKRRISLIKRLVATFWLASLCVPQSSWAQKKETAAWTPSAPFQGSPQVPPNKPPKPPKFLTLGLQYEDPNNKGQAVTGNVQITVAKWDRPPKGKETFFEAQHRKAKAIADAINNANLGNVKANLGPDTMIVKWPGRNGWIVIPVPIAQTVTITNLFSTPKKPTYWQLIGPDVTREIGNGVVPGPRLIPNPEYKGTMDGARSGMSTGVDPFGEPSVIAFGFYSSKGEVVEVATLVGAEGLSDSEILGELASQFNSLCEDCGLTAVYNPTSDTLGFDQSLGGDRIFFMADTDTGVGFGMSVSAPVDTSEAVIDP